MKKMVVLAFGFLAFGLLITHTAFSQGTIIDTGVGRTVAADDIINNGGGMIINSGGAPTSLVCISNNPADPQDGTESSD